MKSTNLLEQFPNLIEYCKEHDCGYSEAIKELSKQKSNSVGVSHFDKNFLSGWIQ